MEQIRQYFEHAIQQKIIDKEWHFFASKLSRQEFPKNHLLLKAGQTEDYLSFIESGIIRYYIPKIENELTFTFVFDGNFASSYDSCFPSTGDHPLHSNLKTAASVERNITRAIKFLNGQS